MAVDMALGPTRTAWVSDIEPGPVAILTKRFPDAPNLGDITAIDWADVEPVDVICGGFPCQPVSEAGARKGIHDERWLFDEILKALRIMDPPPRLCVFENVLGLLTANRGDAMARVIEGLASVGYMGCYGVLPASSVGAAHRRARVFIVAYPHDQTPSFSRASQPPRPRFSDGNSEPLKLLPTLEALNNDRRRTPGFDNNGENFYDIIRGNRWAEYEPAITRWEKVMGRRHPNPEGISATGLPQVSSKFAEWFMGLPEGWVTDIGLSHAAEIRALGNGVVPQQGAAAITQLLGSLP